MRVFMKTILQPHAFPEQIEGNRIILKKTSQALAREMYQNVNDDRARLREFLPWVDQTISVEDEIKYIQRAELWWDERSTFQYGFFRKSDGVYLGNGGVHAVDWGNERLEIGYVVWQPYEGQGYISELVGLLEAVSFAAGFYRLEIRCDPKNIRSVSVAQRLGYQQEGHFRSHQVRGSQRRDTLIFAKLRNR